MALDINAVIFAAGFSSRLVPICFDIPKGLMPVRGLTLIERQILQLREVGVKNIVIVTGYKAFAFESLKKKYGVTLVHNPFYETKNNFSSYYVARSYMGNTIITSSDLYFCNNIFKKLLDTGKSCYASVYQKGATNHRSLVLDENGWIVGTSYSGYNTWITFGGVAFLTEKASTKLTEYIVRAINDVDSEKKYWVDFQDEHLFDIPMTIAKCSSEEIVEFNTIKTVQDFDKDFMAAKFSSVMRYLIDELKEDEREFMDFSPIKKGSCAIGCQFICKGRKYQFYYSDRSLKSI
jgi:CTP:phosphocholine cytidylyltransferase-like protein